MLPHDLGHGHGKDGIEDGVTLRQQSLPSMPRPQILQPAQSQTFSIWAIVIDIRQHKWEMSTTLTNCA